MTPNQAQHHTAGGTARLTLLQPVRTALRCAWCNAAIDEPRRNQVFCEGKCRTANNEAKWGSAPLAIQGWLAGRTASMRLPSVERIAQALEWAGSKRRARLLNDMGLMWDARAREWQTTGVQDA